MRVSTVATLAVLVLVMFGRTSVDAQTPTIAVPALNRGVVAALTAPQIAQSNDLISRMTQSGDLRVFEVHDDPTLAGRRHETLRQYYRGISVEGGGVTRQLSGGTVVSIFGTLNTDIAIETTPVLNAVDAARLIERAAGRTIAFGASPSLVILPSPTGTYSLVYKATVEDAVTYYADALTGQILKVVDEKKDDVGVGTGVLGDSKKLSTTQVGGVYRTRDQLRPTVISTFDTGGSTTAFNRLINTGASTDADLGSDSDNTWTDGRIVDAHVHTGWVYDYFFKRHGWAGLDGQNRPMSDIVHRGLTNNAQFIRAPFGPGGNGAMVYGDTSAGVPVSSLDVAGHELMHGVTYFSVSKRTGQGLGDAIFVDTGTTSFAYKGQTFSCASTTLTDSQGVPRPFWCSNGRYVIGSNDGGAVNEAFSDIFGTSVEFFNQPAGNGPLKADYLMAEDIPVFGPNRSLINPGSITFRNDTGGSTPYPDNRKGILSFAFIILQGTQANPTSVAFAPLAYINGSPVTFFDSGLSDSGGVHLNATVLGQAFYLAIEGGKNATSGLSVTGVGSQNRALVERAFFRAMTQLMPNAPSQSTAALAVYQAAVDLFGVTSPTSQAIAQAMIAVGLLVAS
ncbi:MAG: M4 family metallopeptidase [Acidobacteriota bacterium]